jgi:hypothetical protein
MRGGGVHLPPMHGYCTRHGGDKVRHPGGRAGGAAATTGRRDGPGADTSPHGGPGTALAALAHSERCTCTSTVLLYAAVAIDYSTTAVASRSIDSTCVQLGT